MTEIKEVSFGFGQVSYTKAVDATPNETTVSGNMTTHNYGSPGSPEYYEVTYMISCELEHAPITRTNIFHWTEIVTGKGVAESYIEIESEAARQLASTLRAVADKIEQLVVSFDSKASKS